MIELPRVVTLVGGSCHVSTASYALAAIQVERVPPEALSERLASRHEATTRLAAFIARMPAGSAVELHWIGLPSLDPYFPGTVEIRLDVCGRADRSAASIELCLENSFRLMRHAATFWPSAEFQPTPDAAMPPFVPCGCLRITRRRERIRLAQPFEKAICSNIGFAAGSCPVGGGGSEAAPSVKHTFPWIASGDDATALAQALLASPVPLWITVRLSPAGNCNCVCARMEADLAACEDFLAGQGGRESRLLRQTAALREVILERACLLREPALRTSVLLRAPGAPPLAAAVLIGQAVSGDFSRNSARNPFLGGYCVRNSRPSQLASVFSGYETEPLSPAEAACAFRLPVLTGLDPCGLPARRNAQVPSYSLPPVAPANGTCLGTNTVRGATRQVLVDIEQRLKHVFVPGMTGTGKSTLLRSMALQDLRQGHGVAVIDPHGDLVDDLLASPSFPAERDRDLTLIDLAARDWVTPLNLIACRTVEERDVIQDELLASVLRIYRDPQMFGPIFEMNFRGMLKLLMGDRPRPEFVPTLLEFPLLYQNPALRRWLRRSINDDQVGDFIDELEAVRGENQISNLAPYVTSKLGRFLQDRRLCRMLGHGGTGVDFDALLENRGVLLVKLARGQFPAGVADLLTSQILTRIRLAAMRRSGRPRGQRRPFFLYVDEFGSLARDENFSMLLSEARKYGLGLVLATQYAGQLRGDSGADSLSAVLGNVGTIVSLRVGAEDAALLAPVFLPAVSAHDLLECPNFEGYARVHLSGVATGAFSLRVPRDDAPADRPRGAARASAALRLHGVTAAECDERAAGRRRFIKSLS